MMEITAVISTKNRYFDTLPLTIESIIQQTYKPKKIIIFDDGEHKDLRKENLYKNILSHIERKNIRWAIIFGENKGQVFNHQKSIELSKTDWIWRIDDDEVAEPDVLEQLISNIDDSVGAIGGVVLDPLNELCLQIPEQDIYNKLEEINSAPNIQWIYNLPDKIFHVEHIYSSFLFRKKAASHGYCLGLSPVGHREETIFTYEMKRKGWNLLINPKAVTWHYRSSVGGLRSYEDSKLWVHDENVFYKKLDIWNKNIDKQKIIILNNGLGDHIAFLNILPEILKKDPNIILSVCYPEIFENFNVKLISIKEATLIHNNPQKDNIYKWMKENNWKRSIVEAYRTMLSNYIE